MCTTIMDSVKVKLEIDEDSTNLTLLNESCKIEPEDEIDSFYKGNTKSEPVSEIKDEQSVHSEVMLKNEIIDEDEFRIDEQVGFDNHINDKWTEGDDFEEKFLHSELIIKTETEPEFELPTKESTCNQQSKYRTLMLDVNGKLLKFYHCNLCEYNSLNLENVKSHINNKHIRKNLFKCTFCGYATRLASSLRLHVNSAHTKEVIFQCALCDHKAAKFGDIRKHFNRVHEEKKFVCPCCEYETRLKSSMTNHVRHVHTKERYYQCSFCEYKTTFQSTIKVHLTSKHFKENLLQCGECEYKAATPSRLKNHISNRHTEVRCDRCQFVTTRPANLRRHIKKNHGIKKE